MRTSREQSVYEEGLRQIKKLRKVLEKVTSEIRPEMRNELMSEVSNDPSLSDNEGNEDDQILM